MSIVNMNGRLRCGAIAITLVLLGTLPLWVGNTYYINIAPHNVSSPIGTVAAAHVCASIPNFLVIEFHAHDVPWWADLVDGEPPIRDGYILLGEGPGHGMTLNEDIAREHLKPGTSFFGDTPERL